MKKTEKIINLLREEFPGYTPEIKKSDPLDMLIATMLSQNTTDKTSYIAFMNLKKDFNGWQDVMNAPLSRIKKAIKVCGLTNQKSESLKSFLNQLFKSRGKLSLNYLKKYSDIDIYNDLLQYKGFGVKTISCMMAFSLGRDVFPVDTHIHRICNRLGLVKTKTPVITFEAMQNKIPEGKKYIFHNLLIRFGRKICRSANPFCGKCRLYDICEFKEKEKFAVKTNGAPKENNFIILEQI